MNLLNRLRLLNLVKNADVATYLSQDPETGHRYLLHWLPSESNPLCASMKGMLDRLPERSRQAIVEAGIHEGRSYLITEELPGFSSLEDWLRSGGEVSGHSALQTEASGGQALPDFPIFSGTLPGEFTRLIQTSTTPHSLSASLPEKGGQAALPRPGEFTRFTQAEKLQPPHLLSTEPVQEEPGEFTRLIQPQAQVSKLLRTEPSSENKNKEPGQFTGLITPAATQIPKGVQRPSGRTPAPQEAGEFTRLMQLRKSPPLTGSSQPEPLNNDLGREPGEFTRLTTPSAASRKEQILPQPPVNAGIPQAAPPGEFTRMFRQPRSEPTPLLPGEDPFRRSFTAAANPLSETFKTPTDDGLFNPPGNAQMERPMDGPSEYTRFFSSPSEIPAQEPSPLAPAQAAAPRAAKNGENTGPALWVAIGVLAFLALCAVILIVYFALKK